VLLCGYSPFRSDDMKELVRQTTEAKITFHDRYWNNVSEEAKGFITALLNPDPTQRLTASQVLTHTWLTRSAPTTDEQHDLSGLRENFDPRARWRHAIGAARAISRLGLAQRSRSVSRPEISDDEEEAEAKPEAARPTHLDVPSLSESRRARTSSSDSLSLEPPAADATRPKTPPVRTEEPEEVEVEVERRMPGSFNYEAADGTNVASPIDVVGVLGGFWRRFRLGQ